MHGDNPPLPPFSANRTRSFKEKPNHRVSEKGQLNAHGVCLGCLDLQRLVLFGERKLQPGWPTRKLENCRKLTQVVKGVADLVRNNRTQPRKVHVSATKKQVVPVFASPFTDLLMAFLHVIQKEKAWSHRARPRARFRMAIVLPLINSIVAATLSVHPRQCGKCKKKFRHGHANASRLV